MKYLFLIILLSSCIKKQEESIQEKIYFEHDSYTLDKSDKLILDKYISYLDHNIDSELLIEGHCDSSGAKNYNYFLGEKRANEALKYISNNGIERARMLAVSKGELELISDIDSQNRRIELFIVE